MYILTSTANRKNHQRTNLMGEWNILAKFFSVKMYFFS